MKTSQTSGVQDRNVWSFTSSVVQRKSGWWQSHCSVDQQQHNLAKPHGVHADHQQAHSLLSTTISLQYKQGSDEKEEPLWVKFSLLCASTSVSSS